ncbi:hypothetical protein HUU05_08810 [candidate division KSB1 bacterium]|nr:hypothetical protein [candidate division KSB1 bacterium]
MKKHLLLLLPLFLFWSGCKKDPVSPEEPPSALPTRQVSGAVALPTNTTVALDQLEVVTLAGKGAVSNTGAFTTTAVAGEKQQIVLTKSKASGKPILLGYVSPDSAQLQISSRSTALALVMMNPMLFTMPKTERERMAQAVIVHARFNELVQRLNSLLQTAPDEVLDNALHPEVYQLAIEIGIATLKGFNAAGRSPGAEASIGDPPSVKNGEGDNVVFVNPRTIYYCAGVFNGNYDGLAPDKMVLLEAKESLVEVRLGWPPVRLAPPTETSYPIGRGQFFTRLESGTRTGLEVSRMLAKTPEGYAFRANAAKSVALVIDALVGWSFIGEEEVFSFGGLDQFSVTLGNLYEIGQALSEGDALEAFTALVTFVENNAAAIARFLVQQGYEEFSEEFLEQIAEIAGAASLAFQIISAGNEEVPFIYDLVAAPPVVDYCFTKDGANFTDCGSNAPPLADFMVSPSTGDVQTVFTFDASITTDDKDPATEIEVRWDFNGDGTWDTDWSKNKRVTHSYSAREAYIVYLEARDLLQSAAIAHTIVNVSGGFASGKHIIIFRDVLPWQNVRIENLLSSHGFTAGPGVNQFEVLPSTQMSTRALLPGESFVIIGNSQDQTFYNRYAANNVRFANFVRNGGTIFWEACDLGWFNNNPNNYGGDLRLAGVIIPGNVGTIFDYDFYNYVTDPALPLVRNLPTIIRHNYASHESFTNLPEGTTIYMVNESNDPTLIEYKYGAGWIIATGQPIEHGYYVGQDLGLLLPKVVSYVLGQGGGLHTTLTKREVDESRASSASPAFRKQAKTQ